MLWSCSSNGQILVWQLPRLDTNDVRLLAAYESPGAAWSRLAVRYQDGKALILLARHAIHLLEAELPEPGTSKAIQTPNISLKSKFTGHPSEVAQLLWLAPAHAPTLVNGYAKSSQQFAFASCASEDRSLNVWAAAPDSEEGFLQGTISFEDTVRCMSTTSSAIQICAILTSGSGAIVSAQASSTPLPATSEKKKRRKSTVPTLDIQCSIAGPTDGSGAIDSCFQHSDQSITIARNSVKPSFHAARIVDEAGQALPTLDLGHVAKSKALLADDRVAHLPVSLSYRLSSLRAYAKLSNQANTRTAYAEPTQSTVLSGEVVQPDVVLKGRNTNAGGSEATLAQRLKSLQVRQQDADIDREGGGLAAKRPGQLAKGGRLRIADVSSLSQSLVQALHSSDAKLLESCLEKTNPKILRNTIRRVPNTLVLPLVEALVERLGRSKQGFGAGAGGVDAMRGHALIEWLRHVLTIHLAYLITVSDTSVSAA
jgi:U3 small nucleolar RNA-associated protein 5